MLHVWLESAGVILLLVYIGMALIVTEFLVKTRGVAGIIGLISLCLYFYAVEGGTSAWMIGLFVIGLLLMIVDGKFIQDGTLATIGLVLMLLGLVFPTNDLLLGAGVASALVLGIMTSFLSLRIFPKRDMWEKLTLRDRLTRETGYSSMNETYSALVGQQGKAMTDMRPSGTIEIDNKRYSAITNGTWVKKNALIEVESVNGTRILVKEVAEQSPTLSEKNNHS